MSIFSAIIEAVTGHIQNSSDYEYESDDDDDDLEDDESFMNSWRFLFGLYDEQGELRSDDDSDDHDDDSSNTSEKKIWRLF